MHYLKLFSMCMLISVSGLAQIKEYGLKLGISNTKFEYEDKTKNLIINGNYGQSIYVNVYAQAYQKDFTSVQIGLGFLERTSVMPIRTAINTNDSITINENWAVESIISNADIKLKIPLDEKFKLTPYFILGPQLNYNYAKSSNIQPSIQKWKINLNTGLGFDYDFDKMNVFLEAQKMVDFNNNISTTNNIDLNQQSLLLAFGIKYIIKH